LPFSRTPQLVTAFVVFAAVKMLNLFPPKGGVSAILSPRTIVSGKNLDCKKHLVLRIGQHCQVHQEDTLHNSQLPRTKGAIALGPGGNLQGSFKFVALDSGKEIARRSWDVVPMSDAVITRVNELGRDQPEQLAFADRRGRLTGDVQQIPGVDPVEIAGVEPDKEDIADMPELDVELPGVDVETGEQQEIVPPQLSEDDKCDLNAPIGTEPENKNDPVAVGTLPVEEPTVPTARRSECIFAKTKLGWEPSLKGNKHHCVMMQLEEQGVLYPDAHMFAQTNFHQLEPNVVAVIVTQLSLKARLKRWGETTHKAATQK